jgi:LTXXQ motif family protein
MEDTMLFLTRTMLPAFALAAMMSVAQAQTATDQDHDAHHPDGAATTAQAQPAPAPTPSQPMQDARPGTIQPGMMMNMDQMRQMMMGQQGGMGLPFEHTDGRIAFLKTELRITDAQTPPWNAFADTLRANAKAHQTMHEQMAKGGMPSSWLERLAFQQKALSTRLDGLKALETAAKPLYAVLTDDQRKLADQLLSGPMGMM